MVAECREACAAHHSAHHGACGRRCAAVHEPPDTDLRSGGAAARRAEIFRVMATPASIGPSASMNNEIVVLGSQELLDAVVEQLGHVPDVSFGQVQGTDVITITTRGERPAQVSRLPRTSTPRRTSPSAPPRPAPSSTGQKASLEREIGTIDARLAGLNDDPVGNREPDREARPAAVQSAGAA